MTRDCDCGGDLICRYGRFYKWLHKEKRPLESLKAEKLEALLNGDIPEGFTDV